MIILQAVWKWNRRKLKKKKEKEKKKEEFWGAFIEVFYWMWNDVNTVKAIHTAYGEKTRNGEHNKMFEHSFYHSHGPWLHYPQKITGYIHCHCQNSAIWRT